ncbi:ComEC/Rec2 family competence protein [Belnapia sp. T18]|uniref:ComEC/Rec2 family competence protein n=1 Tax=Belnapia arida TaxID=2804533 RepID=A0ABS1U6U2_9PROT|nr:ComEC/Rec2 family competence protein [Belnapia arida]MBL6080265.1 ComEC/Rec2 family competence protein [Belnapia arida]
MFSAVARPAPRWPGRLASTDARKNLLADERPRLALWLAVALGAGVLVYFAWPSEPPPAARWLAPPLSLLALWIGARRPVAGLLLGLLAAGAVGFALASWQAGRVAPPQEPPRGATILSGSVAEIELLPEGRRVTLRAVQFDGGRQEERMVRVRLKPQDPARPEPGDRLTVRAMIQPPGAPAHPGGWDFQRAAYFSGLGGSGYALGMAAVVPGETRPIFAGLRASIEARVTEALPGVTGAIAAALITGGQSAIPGADLTAMRDSGLAHLLSVSGLHIVAVMGIAFTLVRCGLAFAMRLPGKAIAALAALAVGAGYLLLSGVQVPMQRSFAMAAVTTLALLAGRRALSLRVLALAAAAVIVMQPAAILGASFQMSFAAVLALIAGWDWLRPRLPQGGRRAAWRRRLALALFGVMATSVLAGLATMPFSLHHFGRVQLYGVVANAVAVPVTSLLVMPAALAAVLLMPFELEGWALAPMGWGVEAILGVARLVAVWPGASLAMQPIPSWGLGICAIGLLWLCLWRTGWRLAGVPLLAIGLLSGMVDRPPDLLVSGDGRLIALRAGDGLFLQRQSGASSFVREVWHRVHGEVSIEALPRDGVAANGALRCRAGACVLRPDPAGAEAALLRGEAPEATCASAAVVVSAEPVRGACLAQVVDRFAVWREGPHAIWLDRGGARVISDRAWRGDRPWVPPMPSPRGLASAAPLAAVD